MKSACVLLTTTLIALAWCGSASAEVISLRIVAWNVESGDANPNVIAQRIKDENGVDIWGLSEVTGSNDAKKYEQAAESGEGADFRRIVGTTGDTDRLVVLYDADRLEAIDHEELHAMNVGGGVRAPLVVHFKGRTTGKEFLFMVNHLYRGSASGRHQQSKMLNQWARQQSLPIITCGDFNYDWHYQTGDVDHDAGYDHLTEDGVWSWVRPETLFPTNASGHNSVLDFVFVSGDAAGWQYESRILVKNGDFPDDGQKSDHRPIDALFTLDTDMESIASANNETEVEESRAERSLSRGAILGRIEELQEEIDRLRALLAAGDDPGDDNNEDEE